MLLNERGEVLLHERDELAPTAAGEWAMVGGHCEPGEDPRAAAEREFAEETGLRLHTFPGRRIALTAQHTPKSSADLLDTFHVFVGRVSSAVARDVVVGEGRQVAFVRPDGLREARMPIDPLTSAIVQVAQRIAEQMPLGGGFLSDWSTHPSA